MTMPRKLTRFIGLTGGLVTASWGGHLYAAETSTDTGEVLEEIVVTAERRQTNLRDVPIAITVITGDALDEKAVRRLEDLQFAAPGLTVTTAGITQAVNIRGVGLASGSPAVTNGVSTYIDGLFQPPIVTTNSFYDIADTQVLRGPQGTFVGSSSTGGAIFINSKSPTLDSVNGYAQAEFGNYSRKALQGAINVPVTETFALRGAVNFTDRNSFYADQGPFANDAGKLHELSGRVGAFWKPSESFQGLLKSEYSDKKTGGFAMRPIVNTTYAAGRVGGIRNLRYDMQTKNDERQSMTSLELRYTAPNGIVVRSLTGYQDKKVSNLTDIDSTSLTAPPTISRRQIQDVVEKVSTEEINIISPTDGALDWVVGAYFQKNTIDVVNLNYNNNPAFPQRIFVPTKKQTTGYFGQVAYQATDALELTLGVRHSAFESEQTSGSGVYINFGSPTSIRVANTEGTHDDSEPTGKVSVNWKLNPDNLLFAFVARGYKPGGFNSATSEFKPETVLDTELGWKSTSLNGRLRSTVNVFNYKYQNFQAQAINTATGTNIVQNLANAKVRGAELELQAIFGGWRFDGGLAYVDSKLGSMTFVNTRLSGTTGLLPQCATGQTTNCTDYTPWLVTNSGGVNLYSPKVTFNAGLEYRLGLSNGATLTPRINYGYVSSQYVNLLYNPVTDRLAARGLASALLTYKRNALNLQLYATNLTNKKYVAGQLNTSEFYGAPRETGVRLAYDF